MCRNWRYPLGPVEKGETVALPSARMGSKGELRAKINWRNRVVLLPTKNLIKWLRRGAGAVRKSGLNMKMRLPLRGRCHTAKTAEVTLLDAFQGSGERKRNNGFPWTSSVFQKKGL